jgi:hypothetical protein
VRNLLGNVRVALAQSIVEERIVVADEVALRGTLSNAPFVSKSKGTRLDVLPLSEKYKVMTGDAFCHSRYTVGGVSGVTEDGSSFLTSWCTPRPTRWSGS